MTLSTGVRNYYMVNQYIPKENTEEILIINCTIHGSHSSRKSTKGLFLRPKAMRHQQKMREIPHEKWIQQNNWDNISVFTFNWKSANQDAY